MGIRAHNKKAKWIDNMEIYLQGQEDGSMVKTDAHSLRVKLKKLK